VSNDLNLLLAATSESDLVDLLKFRPLDLFPFIRGFSMWYIKTVLVRK